MLEVAFVRRRGQRDKVYVTRSDGTNASWAFPSYGDGLPHDLCHLVVEDELGLTDGFWGLVDAGAEVAVVDNQTTLVRDGRPLVDDPAADFDGLRRAEDAVAALGSPLVVSEIAAGRTGADTPPRDVAAPEMQLAIRARLADLLEVWAALPDGGAIRQKFPSAPGSLPPPTGRGDERENGR